MIIDTGDMRREIENQISDTKSSLIGLTGLKNDDLIKTITRISLLEINRQKDLSLLSNIEILQDQLVNFSRY